MRPSRAAAHPRGRGKPALPRGARAGVPGGFARGARPYLDDHAAVAGAAAADASRTSWSRASTGWRGAAQAGSDRGGDRPHLPGRAFSRTSRSDVAEDLAALFRTEVVRELRRYPESSARSRTGSCRKPRSRRSRRPGGATCTRASRARSRRPMKARSTTTSSGSPTTTRRPGTCRRRSSTPSAPAARQASASSHQFSAFQSGVARIYDDILIVARATTYGTWNSGIQARLLRPARRSCSDRCARRVRSRIRQIWLRSRVTVDRSSR